jgi:hypothetical protein
MYLFRFDDVVVLVVAVVIVVVAVESLLLEEGLLSPSCFSEDIAFEDSLVSLDEFIVFDVNAVVGAVVAAFSNFWTQRKTKFRFSFNFCK